MKGGLPPFSPPHIFESGVLGILVGHDVLVMVGPARGFGGYLAGICGVKHFPAVRDVVRIQGEGQGGRGGAGQKYQLIQKFNKRV